jgi:pyruvate/2-oxoglutarate dehydrogenase complex dihydrolipoamide dehydrogenase (E3) component
VVIGGGPIAVELAQAFARLGIRTTVLSRSTRILQRDEPELATILQQVLTDDGVDLQLGVDITEVTVGADGKTVHGVVDGVATTWTGEELLVAVGRTPNLDGLGLDDVGVEVNERGVVVDERLRSSVPSTYAAGDVAGRHLFTHSAGYEAVRAVRDMFFPGKGKAGEAVPWCTFTDPELAHTGLTVAEAEERYGDDVQVWRQDLIHSDRARADSATAGAILVVTHKNKVVGGHILAPAAGEMIHELALAIREGVGFSSLGGLVHVYPTLSTGIFQLAGEAAFEKAESFRWLVKKGKR